VSRYSVTASASTAGRPLVSVIIPTYNYARFLPEAIESVLAQDYPNLEILLSDDNSADDSAAVLARYAARDARIRVHVHPRNLGMVAHWNWCLQQVRGEYVKFLFGDDRLVSPHAISRLADLLEACPDATLACSSRLLFDERSRVEGLGNDLHTAGRHFGRETILQCLARNHNLIGEPSAVLFRREAAQRGFLPELRQLVDLEMWFHLLMSGNLVYTPEPLCAFRRHAAQQTQVNRRQHVDCIEMARTIIRYLDRPGLRPQSFAQQVAYHRIVYRTIHALRKAVDRSPGLAATARELTPRLSLPWRAGCWGGEPAPEPGARRPAYSPRCGPGA